MRGRPLPLFIGLCSLIRSSLFCQMFNSSLSSLLLHRPIGYLSLFKDKYILPRHQLFLSFIFFLLFQCIPAFLTNDLSSETSQVKPKPFFSPGISCNCFIHSDSPPIIILPFCFFIFLQIDYCWNQGPNLPVLLMVNVFLTVTIIAYIIFPALSLLGMSGDAVFILTSLSILFSLNKLLLLIKSMHLCAIFFHLVLRYHLFNRAPLRPTLQFYSQRSP